MQLHSTPTISPTTIHDSKETSVGTSSAVALIPGIDNRTSDVQPLDEDIPIEPEQVEENADQGGEVDMDAEVQVQEDGAPPAPEPHPVARARALPRPVAPTRAEREAHEVCHLPYAVWCRHCVLGCAQNDPHRRLKKHDGANVMPVVSMDFAFTKRVDQEKTSPVLVLRDHKTRMTFCHPVPGKSTVNEPYSAYTVDAVVNDLQMMDRKKCILKSDQEPAMKGLQEMVQRRRCGEGEQTILENSPVDESQANGVVEKAIK